MLGCEIGSLSRISRKVEQLPVCLAERLVEPTELPVSLPHRTIAKKLPGQVVLLRAYCVCLACQHGAPGFAEKRRQLVPLMGFRITGARDFEQRRHQISDLHESVVDTSFGSMDRWTADDERVPDTAFREPALILAEGGHRH